MIVEESWLFLFNNERQPTYSKLNAVKLILRYSKVVHNQIILKSFLLIAIDYIIFWVGYKIG